MAAKVSSEALCAFASQCIKRAFECNRAHCWSMCPAEKLAVAENALECIVCMANDSSWNIAMCQEMDNWIQSIIPGEDDLEDLIPGWWDGVSGLSYAIRCLLADSPTTKACDAAFAAYRSIVLCWDKEAGGCSGEESDDLYWHHEGSDVSLREVALQNKLIDKFLIMRHCG